MEKTKFNIVIKVRNIIKEILIRINFVFKILLLSNIKFNIFCKKIDFPDISSSADIFSLIFLTNTIDKPNPKFSKLFRDNDKNPESVEEDVAHFLFYLTKQIKAKTIIEVGVYRGASSLHFAQALGDKEKSSLHLIDISQKYLDKVKFKIRKFRFPCGVYTYVGNSVDVVKNSNLPKADIIFIDADHGEVAVKNDFNAYYPLLNDDGFMIIHDTIMWPGARKIANTLHKKGFNITTIATGGGAGMSIIRKGSQKKKEIYI